MGGAPLSRHICLAGGFKTMSAAMQKAAAVLGAAQVFHVLADPLYPAAKTGQLREARTAEGINDSLARRAVRHLRLGPESAWPQLRTATAADYPLATAVSPSRCLHPGRPHRAGSRLSFPRPPARHRDPLPSDRGKLVRPLQSTIR